MYARSHWHLVRAEQRNLDRSETPRPPSPGQAAGVARAAAAGCCIVLMMKSAASSKRRLAAAIGGERATHAARHLIDCAREDLESWRGKVCIAPADAAELAALGPISADGVIVQRGDNLGERINHVNAELVERGIERQVYVGIDCPMLDLGYLERAAMALIEYEVVFGPALDGGVVLMGVRGRWPDLSPLPWSTGELFGALESLCAAAGARASVLEPLRDVDTLDDLLALRAALAGDPRPGRRALSAWLAQQRGLQGR
jgi:glycosyltransferase A (GT-A) superfamily protein (DUF2064 family)